jgi:hypothetical protein
MAQNLEIIPDPANESHYVLRGGTPIARFNTLDKAEKFLEGELAALMTEQELGMEP